MLEFSLEAIQQAHSQYTGVDFPKLIHQFKLMGMKTNTCDIQSGIVVYEHTNGERIQVHGNPVDVPVHTNPSKTIAKDVLQRHQAGETDFLTFCREIAAAGVCQWVIDLEQMTCSYVDLQDGVVIVEEIPKV